MNLVSIPYNNTFYAMDIPTPSQLRTSLLQFTPDDIIQEQSDSDSDCENEMEYNKQRHEKKMSQVHLHGKESFAQWNVAYAMFITEVQLNQQIQADLVDQLLEKTDDAIKMQQENINLSDELIRLQIENASLTNQRDKEENRAERLLGLLRQVQQMVQDPSIQEILCDL